MAITGFGQRTYSRPVQTPNGTGLRTSNAALSGLSGMAGGGGGFTGSPGNFDPAIDQLKKPKMQPAGGLGVVGDFFDNIGDAVDSLPGALISGTSTAEREGINNALQQQYDTGKQSQQWKAIHTGEGSRETSGPNAYSGFNPGMTVRGMLRAIGGGGGYGTQNGNGAILPKRLNVPQIQTGQGGDVRALQQIITGGI